MNGLFERPDVLQGCTYKIKTPASEHAVYITITDYVVNQGEHDEHKIPYEIFLSSKNMEQYQWITGLMRTISFVFRHSPERVFDLVGDLKTIVDPKDGNYCKKGFSGFMPSLVADIAYQIEKHLNYIGWNNAKSNPRSVASRVG